MNLWQSESDCIVSRENYLKVDADKVHVSYFNRGRVKQTEFGCLAGQSKLTWSGFP
ncbi:hypothetical protein C8J55DRAFT_508528 [Lentinula edodes]|uniref:Uncharacterized protein n=1 Tax=Lentinula lateritia TaxID=40482 RepID=A0A9W9AMX7_9AGAR|nr:hypothetical protein C8J55DRAFT_508528 [Lentinula edodes]